jgi:hypothetical protein
MPIPIFSSSQKKNPKVEAQRARITAFITLDVMMQSPRYNNVIAGKPEDTFGPGRFSTQQLELMHNNRGLQLASDGRELFIIIDDLGQKIQEISAEFRLSAFNCSLNARRGTRREVSNMNDARQSMQIKGSGRTYFLDIESTRGGKHYLKITESRKGGEDKWERNSINVFPEDADEFAQAVAEMVSKLGL